MYKLEISDRPEGRADECTVSSCGSPRTSIHALHTQSRINSHSKQIQSHLQKSRTPRVFVISLKLSQSHDPIVMFASHQSQNKIAVHNPSNSGKVGRHARRLLVVFFRGPKLGKVARGIARTVVRRRRRCTNRLIRLLCAEGSKLNVDSRGCVGLAQSSRPFESTFSQSFGCISGRRRRRIILR